jgi:hypothetical protein
MVTDVFMRLVNADEKTLSAGNKVKRNACAEMAPLS